MGMFRWWRGRQRIALKECKTAVHPFTYDGYTGFTANPYNGCGHRCVYCYATFEWFPNFYDELQVKVNFPTVLSRQLWENYIDKPIFLSSATDPYQPLEQKFRLTRKTIEILQHHRVPYYVFTKSAGVLRDLELHSRYRDNCIIVWSLTTVNQRVKRLVEPFSSPPQAVLRAMRELSYAGVTVGANIDPIIPGLTDLEGWVEEVVDAVAESGGSFVATGALRLRRDIWERLRRLLQSAGMEDVAKYLERIYPLAIKEGAYADPPSWYVEELVKRVEIRAKRRGLAYGIPLPQPRPKPLKVLKQAQLIIY